MAVATKSLPALKREALKAGMKDARGASRDELEAFLSGGKKGTSAKKTVAKKVPVKKATTRKASTGKASTRQAPARKAPTARKASARKAPARATTRKAATRATASTRKATTKATSKTTAKTKATSNGSNGWSRVEKLDWVGYDKEAWNPRDESVVGIIFKSLKKFRGNRTKTFDALKSQINTLAPKTSRLGNKRTKAEQENWLRYRINQTVHNFATKTGQHQVGTGRKPYERNGKPKASAARARKAAPAATKAKASNGRRKATTARRSAPVTARKGKGGKRTSARK